jgi:hypothetical protein
MLSLEIVQSFTLVLIKRARLCTAEQLFVPNDSRACSIVMDIPQNRGGMDYREFPADRVDGIECGLKWIEEVRHRVVV